MKYLLYKILAVGAMMAAVQTSTAQEHYLVNGSLKGINQGTVKIGFYDDVHRQLQPIDSGKISHGRFELKGSITGPRMVRVDIMPGNWFFEIFLENGPVTIKADTNGAVHYDYRKYGMGQMASITRVTETGSKNFDDYQSYLNNPGQKQYDGVKAELDKEYKATGKDVDAEYRVRDKMDSVNKLLQAWQLHIIDAYIDQQPSSVAGIYMFCQLYRFTMGTTPFGTLDGMLNKFTGEAKTSPYYAELDHYRMMLKAVQVGETAPDFTLLQRDSSRFTLSSLRGHYTMIDFWASWCHPCRQAIPHWKEVYNKYHDKGFDIISVSDDNNWKAWEKAMDIEKMPWHQVDDEFNIKNMPARVGSLYMTTFIPFYVLLDPQGKILVYSGDEGKIDQKLAEVFDKQ